MSPVVAQAVPWGRDGLRVPPSEGVRTFAAGLIRAALPQVITQSPRPGKELGQTMVRSQALRRHRADVEVFARALGSLCEVLEQEPTFNGDGTWYPRKGEETEAGERAREVDRLSGRAAYGFAAAGSFVEWKPRGTWNTQPVNPATTWRTIIDSDPMFPPGVIFACCDQATGILEDEGRAG